MIKKLVQAPLAIMANLLLVMVLYMICRVEFLLENWEMFSVTFSWDSFLRIMWGGLWFDASAVCYSNLLYIILVLIPVHVKSTPWYHGITRWAFVLPNALCLIANLCDSVYYPYGLHRATTRIFNEFGNESNLGTIFSVEVVRHWYLVLLAAVMIYALWRLYRPAALVTPRRLWRYYVGYILLLAVAVASAVCGMRGASFFTATRPLAVSGAHQFAKHPSEANLVLNTPFALIRTLGKRPQPVPRYFTTPQELDSVYTPLHQPVDSAVQRRKNVAILMVESFATEFIGGLNDNHKLDNGTYCGYTPFIDSLIPECLTFETTLANGPLSIDAMPSVLASIPRIDHGFFVSPYSLNHVTSFATELKHWGYSSAFFHGGDNESMGFQGFARGAGFEEYYGRTEYEKDDRFNGAADFDGTWAIWDEEFLQFYALKMSEMKEPFVTGVFTASSHHPFKIPEKYKDRFPDEGQHLLHKGIKYADYSLRRFFETASRQPWFDNTLFVIVADHSSSKTSHDEYRTAAGMNHVPILMYDPTGEMPRGVREGIMQQIDILPTMLGYMGYDRPFVAFGNDVLRMPAEERWAFNCDNVPQIYMGNLFMQTDRDCNVTAVYDYRADILMRHDVTGRDLQMQDRMQRKVKGIIQSYMERMEADSVRVR